jgi:hypothetical protein
MKILRNSFVLFVLIFGFNSYGQDNCNYKEMTTKIDSISRVKNIELGTIKILDVTNAFGKTITMQRILTKESKFHFDGQFLVTENKYFNINKLLYFYIRKDVLEFYFQGY